MSSVNMETHPDIPIKSKTSFTQSALGETPPSQITPHSLASERTQSDDVPTVVGQAHLISKLLLNKNNDKKNVSLESLPKSSSFFLKFMVIILILFMVGLLSSMLIVFVLGIPLSPSNISNYLIGNSHNGNPASNTNTPTTGTPSANSVSLTIEALPQKVNEGSTIPIIVDSNQPNTLVTLRITEQPKGRMTVLAGRTDATGKASIIWQATIQGGKSLFKTNEIAVDMVANIQITGQKQTTSNTVSTSVVVPAQLLPNPIH